MKRTPKALFASMLLASLIIAAPAFAVGTTIATEGATDEGNSRAMVDIDGFTGCFWLWSLFGACR